VLQQLMPLHTPPTSQTSLPQSPQTAAASCAATIKTGNHHTTRKQIASRNASSWMLYRQRIFRDSSCLERTSQEPGQRDNSSHSSAHFSVSRLHPAATHTRDADGTRVRFAKNHTHAPCHNSMLYAHCRNMHTHSIHLSPHHQYSNLATIWCTSGLHNHT
jgi:hypothetical protein